MVVVGVAADTRSGTVAPWDRKNLKPWVTDPEMMARYDAVVALKTDRLSRGDQQDFTRIKFWATQHGKRLIIVDGPQYPARKDSHHDSDYWQWHAEKMAARKEWESIRDRSVRATDRLLREVKFTGKPPWGYVTEGPKYDKRMVATPEGRELIPQVYDKVIAGQSLAAICAWLDTLHVKQRRGPRHRRHDRHAVVAVRAAAGHPQRDLPRPLRPHPHRPRPGDRRGGADPAV
jgi:DNA invertase Pin-like site-specific DNA recombinase